MAATYEYEATYTDVTRGTEIKSGGNVAVCNTKEPDEDLSLDKKKTPAPDPWRRKDKNHFPKWRR